MCSSEAGCCHPRGCGMVGGGVVQSTMGRASERGLRHGARASGVSRGGTFEQGGNERPALGLVLGHQRPQCGVLLCRPRPLLPADTAEALLGLARVDLVCRMPCHGCCASLDNGRRLSASATKPVREGGFISANRSGCLRLRHAQPRHQRPHPRRVVRFVRRQLRPSWRRPARRKTTRIIQSALWA